MLWWLLLLLVFLMVISFFMINPEEERHEIGYYNEDREIQHRKTINEWITKKERFGQVSCEECGNPLDPSLCEDDDPLCGCCYEKKYYA